MFVHSKSARTAHDSTVSLMAIAFAILMTVSGFADESKGPLPPKSIQDFVRSHCVDCHNPDTAEGDLDLKSLTADFGDSATAQKWIEALDRINLGEMPPEDRPRPDAKATVEAVTWISEQIRNQHEAMSSTQGRVLMRRMTRLEYARTVSDLFSIKFVNGQGPLDQLPPDGAIAGFDRHSRALMIDPSLMDAYFSVAEQIARQVIRFRPPAVSQKTMRFDFRHTADSAMRYLLEGRGASLDEGCMVLMEGTARTYGMLRHPSSGNEIPETGAYRIRVRAGASKGSSQEPVFMKIKQGAGDTIAQFRVDASREAMEVYEFETTRSSSLQGEFDVEIIPGTEFRSYVPYRGELIRKADDAFSQGDRATALRMKARLRAQGDMDIGIRNRYRPETLDLSKIPKLYLDWIEVTGPLREPYPPASMTFLFPNGWSTSSETETASIRQQQMQIAKDAFSRLLPRAYRRLVSSQYLDPILALIEDELDQGQSFESALQTGVVAVLCSPHFLFLHEPIDYRKRVVSSSTDSAPVAGVSDPEPRALTSLELATRMSYFLWSSRPDDDLMRTAIQGKLSDEKGLQNEISRMLDSPKIEGFIQGFVRQWLRVDEFNRFPPDEGIFPRFHEARFAGVENDFNEQPLAMVREILQRDAPIIDLIDSDWTMLSGRLAEYYEIAGIQGESFRRVQLKGRDADVRGGLLGMAGIHRWGSDGSRTKPVDRGKYILDVLFNDPPPPPPPNAGEVEPNLGGQKLTVRERLSKHREQETCNHCHRRIDPYGLALENFNTVGMWRELEDGEKPIERWGDDRPAIDPSGRLMTGAEFENFVEFKGAIKAQQQRFVRGLTEKLLSYALARSIEPSDRVLIDALVQRCETNEYSLKTLLASIIQSKAFRTK